MKSNLKKILATIIICFLLLICYSQLKTNTNTFKTDTRSLVDSSSIYFTPKGWVNDYENLFTEQEIFTLDSMIADFEKKTTIEIAIVTIDTNACAKNSFDDFTLELARIWGVGKNESNNGILIGLSKGFRKIRINNARGIENLISDTETKEIIQNEMIPAYKNDNYYQGTIHGIEKLILVLNTKLK